MIMQNEMQPCITYLLEWVLLGDGVARLHNEQSTMRRHAKKPGISVLPNGIRWPSTGGVGRILARSAPAGFTDFIPPHDLSKQLSCSN